MSAANVVEALAAVVAELPAIGRDGRASQQQGGYAYRGIEQITQAAQPLLAKHGVVFAPNVVAMEIRDLVVNGKPWTDTILTVEYEIRGPGGIEDLIRARVIGIGRDNSDKGANKALTQAFKYALIQVLCIADGKDDGDGQHHEADSVDRSNGRAPSAVDPDDVFPVALDDIATMRVPDVVKALIARGITPAGAPDDLRAMLREAVGTGGVVAGASTPVPAGTAA